MRVELFSTGGCERCAGFKDTLQAAALSADPGVVWRDIDPLKELDYAVELGVATLPALAIDGKLVFSSLPSSAQLRKAVLARRAEISDGH